MALLTGAALGGIFSGNVRGQSIQQIEKLTPEQQRLVSLLAGRAAPAIEQVPMRATVPGMEFAPGGPSPLQQQGFDLMSQLPGQMQFDPSQIESAMAPVGQFAREGFRQETIPAIMSALGAGGGARSSGAAGILGREGRNLELGLASQFAPMQFQGLQQALGRQMQIPGMTAGMGGLQRGIGEEQRQFGLDRFMAQAPEASPRLGFIGPAFTSAYDTAVQQGFYEPSILSQLAGAGASFAGAYAGASDERLKENIEHIDNALEKVGKLDGKVYKFKFKDKERDGGVIAQELEKVLPEAVVEVDGIKYVKYEGVIALLVNAVNELARKVG